MGFFTQLLLLLWKNFTLRKRQTFRLVAEIIFPLALFLILVIVRLTKPDLKVHHPECHFDGKAMPSAGTLPFLQSFMCTINNTCYEEPTAGERPDFSQSFSPSMISTAVTELEGILTNRVELELITDTLEDINILVELYPKLISGNTTGNITLGNTVIDPALLRQQILTQNLSLTSDVVDWLLNATLNTQLFQSNVDETSIIDLAAEFLPLVYQSDNQTVEHIRQKFCDEKLMKRLFWFPDNATADRVHDEICNLTSAQLVLLFDDFTEQFNSTEFFNQVVRFVESNAAGTLNFGDLTKLYELFENFQAIQRDLQDSADIRSLMEMFQEMGTSLPQTGGITPAASSNPLANLDVLGRLVCGRSTFFSVDESGSQVQRGSQVAAGLAGVSGGNDTLNNDTLTDVNSTVKEHCKQLYGMFSGTSYTRIFWRQLKPLILGKILYYPQNNVTDSIINDAGELFRNMESIVQLAADWLVYSPSLSDTLNSSRVVDAVRRVTESSLCSFAESYSRASGTIPAGLNSFNGSVCTFLGNYLYNGPNTTGYDWRDSLQALDELFQGVVKYGECFDFDKFRGYDDARKMMDDGISMIKPGLFWAAIEFQNMDGVDFNTLPTHITYKLRFDIDRVDSTSRVQDKYYRPGPRRSPWSDLKYFTFGFAYLQDMVEHAIIKLHTGIGGVQAGVGIFTQQFPYPCYIQDKFLYAISRMLPLFMVLAWILTTAMLCKSIVYEKERRLKEVMKIMGLGNFVHWVAWFINAFIMMFATIVLLVILLKAGKVIEKTDPSVLLFFLTIFSIATIVECFLISTFFSRPNLAACCAGFIYFMSYLPYMLMIQWEDKLTIGHKLLASLSANVAFGYGCNFIALYEEQSIGLQWSNIGVTPLVDDDFNMLHCIFMMIVDTVIYALLTWYIEAVFPGQYGMPKRWFFPIQKSYWCGHSSNDSDREHGSFELTGQETDNIEAEPRGKKVGVAVRNLKKVYRTGNKLAVDGLTINFYEDQITSFLGHNGAGKTTTMSILTGLFPPSDGTAYIQGENIRTGMDNIRHSLGVCPQHNVLFDFLTVQEHLWFYARLKGSPASKVKVEMEQMIKDVGLPNKRHERSENLSGGMKRKLSVAIAFVGGSKTVILDEPTAGVDPYARRAIWQLLLKLKLGRTIILSTHHMDEADVLGDRIAIISQGKLCCVGSSLFLKNRYGSGYYLTLVRGDAEEDEEIELQKVFDTPLSSRPTSATSVRTVVDVQPAINEFEDEGYAESKSDRSDSPPGSDPPTPPPEGAVPAFSVKKVTAFITKYVKKARLVEDNTTELCYQLPDEAAHEGAFAKLFLELERSHKVLGISSFGISDTSLEEVFLKVAEQSGVDDEPGDEIKRNQLEQSYDGGRVPRPVTKLSFRRKKKLSLLGNKYCKVNDSQRDLLAIDDDAESVASVPVSEYGDGGFSHSLRTKVTGWKLVMRQFVAIIIKRFHHVRRSKKGFLCEVVLPAGFILLAMFFSMITPPFEEEPALELHPWHYVPRKGEQNLYMFYANDGMDAELSDKFESMLQKPEGVGNRCVNKHSINGYPCQPVGPQTWTETSYTNETLDCDCSSGWPKCPAGAGGPTPSQITLDTTDRLYNMTSREISGWLLKTLKQYQRRRFGGLSFGELDPLAVETNVTEAQAAIERILTAANNGTPISLGNGTFWGDLAELIPTLAVRDVAKVWFNNKGWAASVSFMNVMNNLILRSNLPSGVDPADYGITAINHPMEMTKEQLNDEALYSNFVDVVIAICVIFAMSFIPASFTMYLIEERVSNSKHLQFVSGVNPIIYWFANFAWDLLNYIVPAVLCIFIFLAFNKQAYVSSTNAPCLVCLLFLYGWAMIPLMYPFSRLFDVPSTALVVLKSVNIFLGTTATLATFILDFLEEDDVDLKEINTQLKKAFLLMPQYCLGRGLLDMAINQVFADVFARFGERSLPNPFDWDQVGKNLFSMFMLGLLFFIINLLIEYNFFIRSRVLKPKGSSLDDEDEDVARERNRVLSGGAKDDILRLEDLTKVYHRHGRGKRITAVDRLCVGVPKGQCFGLLGVNGAGKTTTFKMLTGDVRLSRGNAYVCNHSILNDMVKVRQNTGYCPQFDALDSLLTGVEHLRFYARLRGIPESEVKEVSDWAVRRLGLLQHANKISSDYSGGNKRKLSTAIALIGNPPIIFLDEPTTGMDPGARRFLWNCINNIVKDGRSVILTSHSMEECEALCGRLAIMVNGCFRCIGSTQHLKNRFGDGYTIILRVSGEFPNMEPVEQFIQQTFPSSVLKEKHHNMLQYQLGSNIQLSSLFGQIEEVRERYNIEDYSVSQTTLDQVFINFAKQQTDLADDEAIELPEDLAVYGKTTKISLEAEEQSVAGSTVGLISSDRLRQSGHSPTPPRFSDKEAEAAATADNLPYYSEVGVNVAPIISMPGADTATGATNSYQTEDETQVVNIKRPRPVDSAHVTRL